MIRQTVEWSSLCTEEQCSACPRRDLPAWREQVMALAAAAAFLLCGIGVILLEGSLMTAIIAGLVAGGSALVLAAKLTGRRLKMCSQQ